MTNSLSKQELRTAMALVRPGKVLTTLPPVAAEEFRVKEVFNDYLRCRKWDGTTEGTADEYVYKPYLLRRTPFEASQRNRMTYDYTGLDPDTGATLYVQNQQRRLAITLGDSRDFLGAAVEERWIEEISPTYYTDPLPEITITPIDGPPIVIPADTASSDVIIASGLAKGVDVTLPEGQPATIKWIEVGASREWRVVCTTHSDDNVVLEP